MLMYKQIIIGNLQVQNQVAFAIIHRMTRRFSLLDFTTLRI